MAESSFSVVWCDTNQMAVLSFTKQLLDTLLHSPVRSLSHAEVLIYSATKQSLMKKTWLMELIAICKWLCTCCVAESRIEFESQWLKQ